MVSVSLKESTDHDDFTRGDTGTGIWMISTEVRGTVCGQAHAVGRLWKGRACWGRHEKQEGECVGAVGEGEIRFQAFAKERWGGRRKNAVGQRAQKWEGHPLRSAREGR